MNIGEIIQAAVGVLTGAFILFRIGYFVADAKNRTAARKIKKSDRDSQFSKAFSTREISESFRKYVRPDCGQLDPAQESDLTRVADIREDAFRALDRFIDHPKQRKHVLVLADSGMGKTTLCINYFKYLSGKKIQACLVTLARQDSVEHIRSIRNKADTVCIVDALDEDPLAIEDAQARLEEIIKQAADFRTIIITCRSQFFRDQTSIPSESGLLVVSPRAGGMGATYKIYHLFLLPFTRDQTKSFISKQFPLWKVSSIPSRRSAYELINRVPELSVRPMLLDLLPDLVRENSNAREIFDLYTYMVDKWCDREDGWIDRGTLISVSESLAVFIHRRMMTGGGDRVELNELTDVATALGIPAEKWTNLSSRSLLNRDVEGKLKFAHRSILEYFIVRAVISGDDEPLGRPWTDVMREVFVSWGYTEHGFSHVKRAEAILARDLSKTTLIPLSEEPASPSLISVSHVERIASQRGRFEGTRRRASPRWRANSVNLTAEDGFYHVDDIDSGRVCRIIDYQSLEREGLLNNFVCPLGDQLSQSNPKSGYRLPSLDEFIGFLEALEAIHKSQLVPENFIYLIGDKPSARSYLLVSFREIEGQNVTLKLFDPKRSFVGLGRKVWLYEASLLIDPTAFRSLKVAKLEIRIDG